MSRGTTAVSSHVPCSDDCITAKATVGGDAAMRHTRNEIHLDTVVYWIVSLNLRTTGAIERRDNRCRDVVSNLPPKRMALDRQRTDLANIGESTFVHWTRSQYPREGYRSQSGHGRSELSGVVRLRQPSPSRIQVSNDPWDSVRPLGREAWRVRKPATGCA